MHVVRQSVLGASVDTSYGMVPVLLHPGDVPDGEQVRERVPPRARRNVVVRKLDAAAVGELPGAARRHRGNDVLHVLHGAVDEYLVLVLVLVRAQAHALGPRAIPAADGGRRDRRRARSRRGRERSGRSRGCATGRLHAHCACPQLRLLLPSVVSRGVPSLLLDLGLRARRLVLPQAEAAHARPLHELVGHARLRLLLRRPRDEQAERGIEHREEFEAAPLPPHLDAHAVGSITMDPVRVAHHCAHDEAAVGGGSIDRRARERETL